MKIRFKLAPLISCRWVQVFIFMAVLSSHAMSTTLFIDDGIILKFGDDAGLLVRDGLVVGTNVQFTSLHDDSVGGQTLASPSTAAAGDWRGVEVKPTALPTAIDLDGLTIRYAGSSNAAALQVSKFAYVFERLWISDSRLGIRALDATNSQFSHLSLVNNVVGMEVSQSAMPVISQSEIRGNTQFGILNLTPQSIVQATGNWWGDASGPKDAVANPNGLGNPVSTGVNYGQFVTSAPLIACSLNTVDGLYAISQPSVTLSLSCRNAVAYRLSESTTFGSTAFSSITPTTTYSFTGGLPKTFTLYAEYQAANGSTLVVQLPTSITYTPPPPSNPVVTMTSPASGAQLSSDTQISANVTSTVGITQVDFRVDGNLLATKTSAPYQVLWPLAGVSLGSHTISVVATNSVGETGQATRTVQVVTLDTTPPTVSHLKFAGNPLSDGDTLTSPALFTATISDASGLSSVIVQLDGQAVSGGSLSGTLYSLPLLFDQVANGAHTLTLIAKDTKNNTTTIALNLTLAIGAPATPTITSPTANSQYTQPNVTVTGSAVMGSQVQVYLNGAPTGSPVSASSSGWFSKAVTLPAPGSYQLSASATSSHGSSGISSPISISYALPPPSVSFLSPGANATVTVDTDIQVATANMVGATTVELKLDGSTVTTFTALPYTWRWGVANVTSGTHTFTAIATDSGGHTVQATRTVNLQITPPPPPPIVTPYTGTVDTITPTSSYGEQPIVFTGQSKDRATLAPVPNAALNLILQVNGYQRKLSVITDAAGQFSYTFTPYPSDAGNYAAAALHPLETTFAAQKQFTLNRLSVSPAIYQLQAARTIASTIPIKVTASAGSGINGITLGIDPISQPSGQIPTGITVTPPANPINLAAGASATLPVQFIGDSNAAPSGTVILTAYASDSGTTPRGTVTINYTLSNPTPALYPQPSFLQAGVKQGEQVMSSVQIENKGLIPATNLTAQLRNQDGSTNVPAWIYLTSGTTLDSLAVGAKHTIQLNAAPTTAVNDGIYHFKIHVAAGNANGGDIPVAISVTQSGEGNVTFNVADIYTNTLDQGGQPIPGLAGATVKVQNQAVYTITQSGTTDSQGNATLNNLPAGYYTYRVSAPNHADTTGLLTIQPGTTATQSVFLDYNLVSVEWSVTETEIPDEYTITLDAVYQTQVPAPVVLMEPGVINIPDLQVGESLTGEITISNYGLVRADQVQFTPPASDQYLKYEFLGEVPTSLEAQQRVKLAYKVTALKALPTGTALLKALGNISGSPLKISTNKSNLTKAGTCGSYSTRGNLDYCYTCANGNISISATSTSFSRLYGQCSGGGGAGGGGNTGGGGGFGTGTSTSSPGNVLGDSSGCIPECESCICKRDSISGGVNGTGAGSPSEPPSTPNDPDKR